ncbi:penicillin acylase family protein [Vibrio sp. TRT 17S01]|uniref:penicillin acylase family protein n=1 Tax=Vibrio sp. TRT 17S01 TaxID=3418505 RepID=UPI003CEC474E
MFKLLFSQNPLTARLFLFLVFPLVLVSASLLNAYLNYYSLQSKEIISSYGSATIFIENDIPNVVSENDLAAFFALGYVHANDRFWQMDSTRRIAKGRVSEIIGVSGLQNDIFFRSLNLKEVVERTWELIDHDTKLIIKSYVQGVNSRLNEGKYKPLPFYLFGETPEPWTEYDTLLTQKVLAYSLSGNFVKELEYLDLAKVKGPSFFLKYLGYELSKEEQKKLRDQVYKSYNYENTITQFSDQDIITSGSIGSNAWVVSGQHTETGYPLLSGDPHLTLTEPSQWYVAKVEAGKYNMQGATIPGIPAVIFGKNQKISWSGTSFMADVVDYIELSETNVDKEQLKTTVEEIRVRADFPSLLRAPIKPIQIEISSYRGSPIPFLLEGPNSFPLYAVKWTGLTKNDQSISAWLEINRSENWDDFRMALSRISAPVLNFLYADTAGNIGSQVAGLIPKRKSIQGILPSPNFYDEHWAEFIDFSHLPRQFNPEEGYIVSANEELKMPDDLNAGWDWAEDYRRNRIAALIETQILKAEQGISVNTFLQMQSDTVDEYALTITESLKKYLQKTDLSNEIQSQLINWDGSYDKNSLSASVFEMFLFHLKKNALSDEFEGYWTNRGLLDGLQKYVYRPNHKIVKEITAGKNVDWCNDIRTIEEETCESIIIKSLNDSIIELELLTGSKEPQKWEWGELSSRVYSNQLFCSSNVNSFTTKKFLCDVYSVETPGEGSINSINVGFPIHKENSGFEQVVGATYRQVIDLSPVKNSIYFLPTKRNENLFFE